MELHARSDADGAWVITLHGELDLAAVPSFRSATTDALRDGWTELIIDLGSVSFIDSAGIGVLIGLRRRMRENEGSLVLRVNDDVFRIIDIAEVEPLFQLEKAESAL